MRKREKEKREGWREKMAKRGTRENCGQEVKVREGETRK